MGIFNMFNISTTAAVVIVILAVILIGLLGLVLYSLLTIAKGGGQVKDDLELQVFLQNLPKAGEPVQPTLH